MRPAPRVYQRIVHRTGGRGMSGDPRNGWFLDAPIYAQVDRDGDGVFELEYRYLQSAVSGDIVGFLPSSGPGSRLEYSMFGVPRYAAGARGNFGADIDDGSGTGTPDGGVDINDLTYFLALYDAGDERVDLDNGSGLGLPDGGTDVNDLLYFLTLYDAGDERVDLDNGSGLGLPDGGTDVNDLL